MIDSSEVQEAILENLGEALIIINDKGAIVRFTSAAESLFLYTREEVIGKNIAMLMPPDIAEVHQGFVEGYRSQEKSTVLGKSRELIGVRKDGHRFPIELIITRVATDNGVLFVGLLKDITDKLNTIKLLNQSLVQAQVASQAKSEFLENMCHEIRTPMNGVLGTLQILQKQAAESSETARLVDRALVSSRLLMTILNDLLDFSKIESNKLDIECVPFSVVDCAIDSLHTFEDTAKQNHITLELEQRLDNDSLWNGDQVRVQQIMLNLLSNAIKFGEQGTVTLTLEELNEHLIIRVKDEGIGMSDAQIKTLCDRFSQADTSTTRKYGGTGLGMAIVSNLIRLMGGALSVISKLGEGSEISVELPLKKIKDTPRVDASVKAQGTMPELAGQSILVVDDNEINLLVMEEMLKPSMASVTLVPGGLQAIEHCQHHAVELVFMDIQMPGMDGKQTLQQLKSRGFSKPVIALTANTTTSQVEEYISVGFDAVLPKPVDFDALYEVLSVYMKAKV